MSNNWKDILLSENKCIKDALEVINSQAVRMAFVVNNRRELIGSITDGDVRRGLLRGLSLEQNVEDVMNISPKHVAKNTSYRIALDIMNREHINCIPVLDQGKIVSIITKDEFIDNKLDNPVFLMAGGFGKRLQPLTLDCPKPLLKVGDTPILQIIIERFIKAGFHNFYISTHYLSKMFEDYFGNGEKWGVSIQYVEEEKPLGTAGALGLLDDACITSPVIVMNGDILTGVDFRELLDFHCQREGSATMCTSEYEYEIPFGVVNTTDMHVDSIVEKPKQKVNINSGIYVLEPDLIKKVKKNVALDMPTLLRKEMANGNTVNTFPIFEYWMDIGRKEDYEQAQITTSKTLNKTSQPQVIPMAR